MPLPASGKLPGLEVARARATPNDQRFFLLIDDTSRYMWDMVLGIKVVMVGAIKRVQATPKKEGVHKLRVLSMNNDDKFTAAEFAAYYADEGI